MNDILITGGTGFIGRHLVPKLITNDNSVGVLTHSSPLPSGWDDVKELEGDISKFKSLPDIGSFDTVIHLAGQVSVSKSISDPLETFRVNSQGTSNILERARRDSVGEFFYLSSAAVYGIPNSLPLSENEPTSAIHPYAASKLAGESAVKAYSNTYDIQAIISRAFSTYGPGQQSKNLIPSILDQAKSGTEITLGSPTPTRDFVYVEDVVTGILALLEQFDKAEHQIYNIGSESETSVETVVETILSQLNSEFNVHYEENKRSEEIEIPRMVSDCSRLRELGWTPSYGLERGIKEAVAGHKYD